MFDEKRRSALTAAGIPIFHLLGSVSRRDAVCVGAIPAGPVNIHTQGADGALLEVLLSIKRKTPPVGRGALGIRITLRHGP